MEFRPTLSPTGGPQFTSRVWKEFCSTLGAQVSLSSGFHPQTNGQTEHTNQELEAALGCVASTNQTTWSEQLPWIEYAHNSLTSSATGLSPFEVSLGYQPLLFPTNEGEHFVLSIQHHFRRCWRAWRATRATLVRTKDRNKRLADRHKTPAPTYLPGQKVWLSTRFVAIGTESRKLTPNYIGPFVVDSLINPVSGRLKCSITRIMDVRRRGTGFAVPGGLGGLRTQGAVLGSPGCCVA